MLLFKNHAPSLIITTTSLILTIPILLTTMTTTTHAFQITPPPRQRQSPKPLLAKKSPSPSSSATFEIQELRAQLSAMRQNKISQTDLTPPKRSELTSYVSSIIRQSSGKNSPLPLSFLADGDTLVGTWRLGYGTAPNDALPREATVYVIVRDEGGSGVLDYELRFAERVWALKRLTARSAFTVDPGPLNPGLVSFEYQIITSDLFGMTIPTGLFGMLKGRMNYIDSVYFDGMMWIERGYDAEGVDFYNVYLREDEG